MIPRRAHAHVVTALDRQAAVALLGPRQVGKTTLALEIAKRRDALYLDLESSADRARLIDPNLFLGQFEDQLVILDEIQSYRALAGHPVAGPSWEGFVIENLLAVTPAGTRAGFYRTRAGAEIYLVLYLPGRRRPWAIEVKLGLAPRPSRGMHSARADLDPERTFIVGSGEDRYPVARAIEVIGLGEMAEILRGQGN